MTYLVGIVGILVGLFALYRFIIKADVAEIRALIRGCVIGLYVLVLLFFALRGQIVISIGLFLLCVPFVIQSYRNKSSRKDADEEREE